MKGTEKILKEELSKHFSAQGQRLTMMTLFVMALIKLCTVNLSKLSKVLNANVKKESNFKRLQRFVKGYNFNKNCFIKFVWKLFIEDKNQEVILTIDRTNWKFGKTNINVLMLGIAYKGTCLPLICKMLIKRGNSKQEERENLLSKLLNCLSDSKKKQIKCLVADRESIGYQWFSYLKKENIDFFIRIKKNAKVGKSVEGKTCKVSQLFNCKHFRVLRKKRWVYGHQLYLAGYQFNANEYLIIASNIYQKNGQKYYGQRWGIEVFFAACKSRGFNFEDTHLQNPKRLSTLIFIISIAFCWALKKGEWMLENGYKIPIKKLKNRKTKLRSIFRLGLDFLSEKLLNFNIKMKDIFVLSCT